MRKINQTNLVYNWKFWACITRVQNFKKGSFSSALIAAKLCYSPRLVAGPVAATAVVITGAVPASCYLLLFLLRRTTDCCCCWGEERRACCCLGEYLHSPHVSCVAKCCIQLCSHIIFFPPKLVHTRGSPLLDIINYNEMKMVLQPPSKDLPILSVSSTNFRTTSIIHMHAQLVSFIHL